MGAPLHGRSAGMHRTRAALLDAAEACVERAGVRATTMAGIAAGGGVAKATLYNHFRTKDDVLAALVHDRVATLAAECRDLAAQAGRLAPALEHAAAALAGSAALRKVASDEPGVLVPLAVPADGPGWTAVRAEVRDLLAAAQAPADTAAVDVVLRWLLSQLLWPVSGEGSAAALVRGLGGASAAPAGGTSSGRAHAAGLGWPG